MKEISVLCYSVSPVWLATKYPNLEVLKTHGEPSVFELRFSDSQISDYSSLWIDNGANAFKNLRELQFRGIIIKDSYLELIASSKIANQLESLKIEECQGFSTEGLSKITSSCRNLRIFSVEGSKIDDVSGQWLNQLAMHNRVLEQLSFYRTGLAQINCEDLVLIAEHCPVVSVKISDTEIHRLAQFFKKAIQLREFSVVCIDERREMYFNVIPPQTPQTIRSLGLSGSDMTALFIVAYVGHNLTSLDLHFANFPPETYCIVLSMCPNLESLEATTVIGQNGVRVIHGHCKNLKHLSILPSEGDHITHTGLSLLITACSQLEHVKLAMTSITNNTLRGITVFWENLSSLTLILTDPQASDFPVDTGFNVFLTMRGNVTSLALYLARGALTDAGLGIIGFRGRNLRSLVLSNVGATDHGVSLLFKGCPKLETFQLLGSDNLMSEDTLVSGLLRLESVKHFLVESRITPTGFFDFLFVAQPKWSIGIIPAEQLSIQTPTQEKTSSVETASKIVGYYQEGDPTVQFLPSFVPLISSNGLFAVALSRHTAVLQEIFARGD